MDVELKGWQSLVLFLMIPAGLIVTGYVGMTLWGWFVVPTFGLPALNIAQAIGIDLVVSHWVVQAKLYKFDKEQYFKMSLMYMIVVPLTFLFFGWVAHFFM